MKIFLQCGIVEHSGHGVPIVVREYGEKAYTFSENMITVTIPFNKVENTTPKNGAVNGVVNLTTRESAVLKELQKNPSVSKKELAELTAIPKTSLDRVIVSLKEKGIVERVGSDKTGYWKIN